MKENDFNAALNQVKKATFEDSKLTIAKQVFMYNCLTTDQICAMSKEFTFEETMLEFAKYAYDYCYDRRNYFKVNDVFTFSSSIDE